MADCPVGMVLISGKNALGSAEAPFCINVTEIPEENSKKPAAGRTWYEARDYCQKKYPGGDLPTYNQWRTACGDRGYCGKLLKKTEARYGQPADAGPVDVDSFSPNPQGVKNMIGNVWEWLSDEPVKDAAGNFAAKVIGGDWRWYPDAILSAVQWVGAAPDATTDPVSFYPSLVPALHRDAKIGFRCAAKPATQTKTK